MHYLLSVILLVSCGSSEPSKTSVLNPNDKSKTYRLGYPATYQEFSEYCSDKSEISLELATDIKIIGMETEGLTGPQSFAQLTALKSDGSLIKAVVMCGDILPTDAGLMKISNTNQSCLKFGTSSCAINTLKNNEPTQENPYCLELDKTSTYQRFHYIPCHL